MFTFKVIPDGGDPFEVTATSRDISKWERDFKTSLDKLNSDMSMAKLEQLAYVASSRRGQWSDTLSNFRDLCDIELIPDDDEGESDPT